MTWKHYLVLIAVLFSATILSAQQLPSTLLWKISGNGLDKPSYLYGTMHLTDERIFNLGDSLYNAIDVSEGFCTEIDPAEFTSLVINSVKKSKQKSIYIKDILSPEKFEKYGTLLAEKLHKNKNDITTDDIKNEKNKWLEESISNGKMNTFLDVYLFDIARRKGKHLGGVEDSKDQEDLPDMISESDIKQIALYNEASRHKQANEGEDFFITAYVKKDLNVIDSISQLSDSLYNDKVLVIRNRKMAFRMDSISHVRSTVFAVGAAHLPGDKGLIRLLKEKGFSVTPVFSSKTIQPSEYVMAELPIKWYDVRDADGLYTVAMPGEAGEVEFHGIMKMKMFFDVFSSTTYMTSAVPTPFSQSMADSLINKMATELFGISDHTEGVPIVINDVPGQEFRSSADGYAHGYLLFKNGILYIAMAKSIKKDSAAAGDINRFLKSFAIAPVFSNDKSITYTKKIKGYEIQLPAQPKSGMELMESVTDSTITSDLYFVIDPNTGAYLFFGTNESAPGYFIENDSITLEKMKHSQQEKFDNFVFDTTYIKNGFRTMEFAGLMPGTTMMTKVKYQFRGNRWYAMVAIYDPSKENVSVNNFFNSFRTLDYEPADWENYESGDGIFQTWAPMAFSFPTTKAASGERIVYTSYDSTRGDTYSFILEEFSKYFWQENDSSFWQALLQKYSVSDTILSKEKVANGYELRVHENGSANIKRIRIILNGDRLGTLLTVQPASEIDNPNNNKFFESFRFNKPSTNTGPSFQKLPCLSMIFAQKIQWSPMKQ